MFSLNLIILLVSIKTAAAVRVNYQYLSDFKVSKIDDYLLYEPKTITLPKNCEELYKFFNVKTDDWQIVYPDGENKLEIFCLNSKFADGTRQRNDQCTAINQCEGKIGLECIEGKCICPAKKYFSIAIKKCLNKKSVLEPCDDENQCHTNTCENSECICDKNSYNENGNCKTKKIDFEKCNDGQECFSGFCNKNYCKCPNERYYLLTNEKKCTSFSDCSTIRKNTNNKVDGPYWVHNKNESVLVYCYMNEDDWTLMMHRTEFNKTFPLENFNKNLDQYKKGFGTFLENYWIGLENIVNIFRGKIMLFSVEMRNSLQDKISGIFEFELKELNSQYVATFGNKISGVFPDYSANHHSGKIFSTDGCGIKYNGGWWFESCYKFCPTCENVQYNGKLYGHLYFPNTNTWKSYKYMRIKIKAKNE